MADIKNGEFSPAKLLTRYSHFEREFTEFFSAELKSAEKVLSEKKVTLDRIAAEARRDNIFIETADERKAIKKEERAIKLAREALDFLGEVRPYLEHCFQVEDTILTKLEGIEEKLNVLSMK